MARSCPGDDTGRDGFRFFKKQQRLVNRSINKGGHHEIVFLLDRLARHRRGILHVAGNRELVGRRRI